MEEVDCTACVNYCSALCADCIHEESWRADYYEEEEANDN